MHDAYFVFLAFERTFVKFRVEQRAHNKEMKNLLLHILAKISSNNDEHEIIDVEDMPQALPLNDKEDFDKFETYLEQKEGMSKMVWITITHNVK
jgi:hypothetical protein